MTIGGWIFLVISLVLVWSLSIWCYRKVLTTTGRTTKPPDSSGG